MKIFFIIFVVFLVATEYQTLYSQKKKNKPVKPSLEKTITVVDRLTKYLPFSSPKPCTFYLTDFGDSREKLKTEAKKIGLNVIDHDTSDLENKGFYCKDPDEKTVDWTVYYDFGFKNGMYNALHFNIDFKEIQDAVQVFDDLKKTLYYFWGSGNLDNLYARTTCLSDNSVRIIRIQRHSSTILMWITKVD